MYIYITDTNIILTNAPPKEPSALFSKYSEQNLNQAIETFPDLKHECKLYTLIHKLTREVVTTHDLAQFAASRNIDQKQINQLKYQTKKSVRNWFLVSEEYKDNPEIALVNQLRTEKRYKNNFAKKLTATK